MANAHKALYSWKEIADCLGVTVRSAQRWEKEGGLPVYRQGGGAKSRVCAYEDELLKWRESTPTRHVDASVDGDGDVGEGALGGKPRRWGMTLACSVGILGVVVGLYLWKSGVLPYGRVPQAWTFQDSKLTVVDGRERICWERRFPEAAVNAEGVTDVVVVGDIDGDGRREVLFNFTPSVRGQGPGALYCLEQSGQLRWRFEYGGPKRFGARSFDGNYVGKFLRTVEADGKRYVLTIANHHLWYPAQAALVDPRSGKALAEYWHPGAIQHVLVGDIDRDGRNEVFLGAINNPGEGLGHAAVAKLSLPFQTGAAPTSDRGERFPAVTGGGEQAYVLFPTTDLNTALGQLPMMGGMTVEAGRRIEVVTSLPEHGGIVYLLDPWLKVVEFRFSDNFRPLHNRLRLEGLLDHSLSQAETDMLGSVRPFAAAPDGNSPEVRRLWAGGTVTRAK